MERNSKIVQLLIKNNCKMEEKNEYGENGFFLACKNNHFQIVDPSHLGQAATGNLNCVPEKRPADSEMGSG